MSFETRAGEKNDGTAWFVYEQLVVPSYKASFEDELAPTVEFVK